ncbi:MAG: acyl-CoA thioesterase [Phycisphaerales bacterium]|nr:acyl-CoA thioesterase [Phycisphaerales bacterium]
MLHPSAESNASAPHITTVRVRYCECDPMGVAHHSAFPIWLEIARTEMLRSAGGNYRTLEEGGLFLAVVALEVKYRRPARYDDELAVHTRLISGGPVKIVHTYEVRCGEELLASASTTLACLGRDGRARALPDTLTLG